MVSSVESQVPVAAERHSRFARLVRWAARLTSIPIFALLLVSLVPALANFSVSARDDKVIALGLCGIAAGFLLGWRWSGIGGLLALGSVAVILSQEEGGLASDPFAVAFGLQGLLFLISWALNAAPRRGESAPKRHLALKLAGAGVLALCVFAGIAVILRGPAPTPVGKEQEVYVGTWENGSGFTMEIGNDGRVKITHDKDAKVQPCNTPVQPGGSGEFTVEFRDDRLALSGGVLGLTKTYHIDRQPFPKGKRMTMVLNGSDPYSRTNGMILVRKPSPDSKPERSAAKTSRS